MQKQVRYAARVVAKAPKLILQRIGQNGLLPQEILDMHPNATYIRRHGEVNAWDNADFRAAVKAANKKQIILAGVTTDVRLDPQMRALAFSDALVLACIL